MATDTSTIDDAEMESHIPLDAEQLTFTGRNSGDGRRLFWKPTPLLTDRRELFNLGCEYGDEMADYLSETDDLATLGGVVREILGCERFSATEVGFVVALSKALRQ